MILELIDFKTTTIRENARDFIGGLVEASVAGVRPFYSIIPALHALHKHGILSSADTMTILANQVTLIDRRLKTCDDFEPCSAYGANMPDHLSDCRSTYLALGAEWFGKGAFAKAKAASKAAAKATPKTPAKTPAKAAN